MQTIGSVYDNGGRTFDRFTIEFECEDGSSYWISSGPTGNVPNGVFMTLDVHSLDGREIAFEDLPERVQRDCEREAAADWSLL